MTLEAKKTFALVGSALAAMVAIAGNILMALQIKTQGAGFYVGYLCYSLAILAGGMFITWLPSMKNHNWGLCKVGGRLKWQKDTRDIDVSRTRLVFWPLITLFFELYGLFDYCFQLWDTPACKLLKYLFVSLTLSLLIVWCIIIVVQDVRRGKEN